MTTDQIDWERVKDKLKKKNWYKNSSEKNQKRILDLVDLRIDFVIDLAYRRDFKNVIEIIKIRNIIEIELGIIVSLEVLKTAKQERPYFLQYFVSIQPH